MGKESGFALIPVLIALVLIIAAVAFAYFQGLIKFPTSTPPQTETIQTESLLKEEYANPFEEESSYQNPFSESSDSEYTNPFDNL